MPPSHTPRKPPTWWLKNAKPASVASQRVTNINEMMPLVGATVESQSRPMTAPNRIEDSAVTGNEMKARAEGKQAPALGQELAERGEHDGEGTAGQAEADEDAGGEVEHPRRRRVRHQDQANGVKSAAGPQHAHGAVAVGDGAGKRLAEAPEDVLDRQREAEHVAAPIIGLRHRREKEAKRGARAKADHGDETAAQHDHERRAPADRRSSRGGRKRNGHGRN